MFRSTKYFSQFSTFNITKTLEKFWVTHIAGIYRFLFTILDRVPVNTLCGRRAIQTLSTAIFYFFLHYNFYLKQVGVET